MDSVKPILDQWIKEDFTKKKKYIRTSKRMYEMLKEQFDFRGSDRSERYYVSKRKRELLEESESADLPLEAKLATAQVDFGEAPFIYNGEPMNMNTFLIAISYIFYLPKTYYILF
jgi:hypothetical protein